MVNASVQIDEEEAEVEHVVAEADSADAMVAEEAAVDSAAAQTETAVSGTTILRIGNPGNVYVNHDGT